MRLGGLRQRDLLPTVLALADSAGREVDLHPVDPSKDGGAEQELPDGSRFHYPDPVPGRIGRRTVACVDAATQVRAHQGYPLTDKDRADLALLTAHARSAPGLAPSRRAGAAPHPPRGPATSEAMSCLRRFSRYHALG